MKKIFWGGQIFSELVFFFLANSSAKQVSAEKNIVLRNLYVYLINNYTSIWINPRVTPGMGFVVGLILGCIENGDCEWLCYFGHLECIANAFWSILCNFGKQIAKNKKDIKIKYSPKTATAPTILFCFQKFIKKSRKNLIEMGKKPKYSGRACLVV